MRSATSPERVSNAKCPASRKLKYRGAFTYKDGTTIEAATQQSCTPKPEPKKK